jgi:integrase
MTSTQNEVSATLAPPAKRRAHKHADGEGSIGAYKGGWRGRLMVGYRQDGKPDVREVYGKTQTECRRKLAELRHRAEQGSLGTRAADKESVAAFLGRWLTATAATLKPMTATAYADIVRVHLVPALGRHRLAALRPEHVQAFHAAKLAAGQAPSSVRKYHAVLHKALKDAMRWGQVARNVCDAVDLPAASRKELHPPSVADLTRLLGCAETAEDPLRALWNVALYSGCRRGELLALTWADVDMDAKTLTVRRTLVSATAGLPRFGEPKTAKSRRTVTLPAPAVEALRAHRQRQLADRLALGPDYASYDLVFSTRLGTALQARNVHRSFKAALGRAELPMTVRLHDLRHAAATMLLQAGVHPKVVSERLGHSTITLTLDTYSHVVPGLDADAAARLERVMQGNGAG